MSSIIREDKLSRMFDRQITDHRFEDFLWFFINSKTEKFIHIEYGLNNRNKMADFLIQNPPLQKLAIDAANRGRLSENCLDWITEDKRQTDWLINYFCEIFKYNRQRLPKLLTERDTVIALIDHWDIENFEKSTFVNDAKFAWSARQDKDRVYDWFKKNEEEEERCRFAWVWLKESATYPKMSRLATRNHLELILLFEAISSSEDWIELTIEKIKKAWNQRRYRQNLKGKKQCNFILTENAINLLNRLSEKHDLTRAEIIEVLIKAEAEKETYISEKLRKRRLLLE
ncbi:hypothetical protein [Aquitalea aquatica]|uniref:Uncharacterized protein n=1 Tax=Aquitalea aquatica TaxID=3044273 RepID=A0A838Y373_9NEIS|nr:hypothetical protein [Aquitalea magnusonii]MBA4709126.1 hypothetical protein [Aquitalea magnusonii]